MVRTRKEYPGTAPAGKSVLPILEFIRMGQEFYRPDKFVDSLSESGILSLFSGLLFPEKASSPQSSPPMTNVRKFLTVAALAVVTSSAAFASTGSSLASGAGFFTAPSVSLGSERNDQAVLGFLPEPSALAMMLSSSVFGTFYLLSRKRR